MISVGIGEIQKNISILTSITESIQIVDKRKKEVVATLYPANKPSSIDRLAGKYSNRVKPTSLSIEEIKEQAMKEAMREKYGISS